MTDAPIEISVQELNELQKKGEKFFLLDVREESEVAKAKITGSALIPLGQLQNRANELPQDTWLVVHCHHGGRSMRAVQWLRANGFPKATNVAGGIDAWSCAIDKNVARY